MKVLLINASPHLDGCTYTALTEAETIIKQAGIETEIFHVGMAPISGCFGCRGCQTTGRCAIDDSVNPAIERMEKADALIVGSPVHYAAASGQASSFLDRFFFSGKDKFVGKPCGMVVSARRAGTTAALDQLIKYPTISAMPVASSTYWCMVHGNNPEEVRQDAEGLQIVRNMARTLSWMLNAFAAADAAGVARPQYEGEARTSFIR